MKKLILLLIGILWLFLFTGCTSVKRFKSAQWKGEDNSLVNVELFSAKLNDPLVESEERNLWDLSASAQTQLIQILNERYPDNGQFINAMNLKYLSEADLPRVDMTGKELQMVFTVQKPRDYKALSDPSSRFSPADRIEYLKIEVEIPSKTTFGLLTGIIFQQNMVNLKLQM